MPSIIRVFGYFSMYLDMPECGENLWLSPTCVSRVSLGSVSRKALCQKIHGDYGPLKEG